MRASETGFGFIEMMVVILLIAVLATVAVPSFRNLVAKTQVNSEVNALITAFYTARNYAIRHNKKVIVCAGSTGSNCQAGTTLAKGWKIVNKAGTKKIREWSKPSTTINSFPNKSSFHSITYNQNGLPVNRTSGHIDICAGRQARKLVVSAVGNVQVQTRNGNCAGCNC